MKAFSSLSSSMAGAFRNWLPALLFVPLLWLVYGDLFWPLSSEKSVHRIQIVSLYSSILCFLLGGSLLLREHIQGKARKWHFDPMLLTGVLVFLLTSSLLHRNYAFFQTHVFYRCLLLLGLPALTLMRYRSQVELEGKTLRLIFSWPLLLLFQGLLAYHFLSYLDGQMIFSDDHPSFAYRLMLLQQNFPNIPFYDPLWQLGHSAREFFASGMLNVFFLALPFSLFAFDFSQVSQLVHYNYLIVYLFILILPWSSYFAARLLKFPPAVSVLSALLNLAPTMGYLEWLLKYGTLGFCCSAALFPLAFACTYRILFVEERWRWPVCLGFFVSVSLVIFWAVAALSFVPLAVVALWFWVRRDYRQSLPAGVLRLRLVCCLGLLVLNSIWFVLLAQESQVLSFLSRDEQIGVEHDSRVKETADRREQKAQEVGTQRSLFKQWQLIRELLVKINPVILVFFLPGIFLFSDRILAKILSLTLFVLFLTVFFGDLLKPQLELRRMIVLFSFLAALPTAGAAFHCLGIIERALCQPVRKSSLVGSLVSTIAGLFLLSSFLATPLQVAAAYGNQTDESFSKAPDYLGPLVEAIREDGGSGRTFFLGFILHEMGARAYDTQDGGHVAILAALSGKEMYAAHYYHRYWNTTDPIPKSYRRRGEKGIEEFLDLVNATTVVTFKREWAKYCLRRPKLYEQVLQVGRFRLFRRKVVNSSYVRSGLAEVQVLANGVRVVPRSREVVIRYRYMAKLRVRGADGVELFPVPVFEDEAELGVYRQVSFIGLRLKEENLGKPLDLQF